MKTKSKKIITSEEKSNIISTFLKKKVEPYKVSSPNSPQKVVKNLFQDFDLATNIMKINDQTYSYCMEYTDISFAKASNEDQVNIFIKWVDYLNSFTEKTHIQVVTAGKSVKTDTYKQDFTFDENQPDTSSQQLAHEFNTLIGQPFGDNENTLENKRYIIVSQSAKSYQEAKDIFLHILLKTEEKFKELSSKIRVVTIKERLNFLFDQLHVDTISDYASMDLIELAEKSSLSIHDILAPGRIDWRKNNYFVIDDHKFQRILYTNKLPKSLTPTFFNAITSLDMNIITTLNITPTNGAKTIKKVAKKISGMKTERYDKVKKAAKSHIDYEAVKDEKLEARLADAKQLEYDIQKHKQKVFTNNLLICITADSYKELKQNTQRLQEIATEQSIELRPVLWQQFEAFKNTLPLGHNTLQFQRSLSSEATAVNVPFNSKDIMHKQSLYYGMNLVSKKPIFCDRKLLLNGNGCVLATSGGGKSFAVKSSIEQIRLRYPDDEIIIVDPQKEYKPVLDAFHGQEVHINTTSDSHINPFDLDLNYGLNEESKGPVKEKVEYVIAFVESIYGTLNGAHKTIIDRCTLNIFDAYEKSNFADASLLPTLPIFYKELKSQPEKEAADLALTLERYVNGSIDIFSKHTNVNIKNKLISFDISELSSSMQATGYLVVLDFIMNRLTANRRAGINTWIFIDEFHILLNNPYSADYIAKIYKIARKFFGLPTIITQNISEVLKSEQGCNILQNSEFALILKQKVLELKVLKGIFNISNEEAKYVLDAPAGQGLVIYGMDCYPFRNKVPEDFLMYHLNETSKIAKAR